MGRVGAFLDVERVGHGVRAAAESAHDYEDIVEPLSVAEQRAQASRCMSCGVAFCQSGCAFGESRVTVGCPLHNLIPETNDLLYRGRMRDAADRLSLTNPFPEFTSRVCPAPCEVACNLGLHDDAVTIHDNERAISDYAWEQGISPLPAPKPDAPLASIIGSGPAGLAAAWELARNGVRVRVYERDERPGGLLMFGIPNMKLPKQVIDRRIALMERSGIEFVCGVDAVERADEIRAQSDAVIVAVGARVPRDVAVEGRELAGICFAVDYLSEVTRALLEKRDPVISAEGKDIVVIGGGDTGVDCVASALRQGAKSVAQVIRAQCPPASCDAHETWPNPRNVYAQGYGQREAQEAYGSDPRIWSTDTIGFVGDGAVQGVRVVELSYDGGRHVLEGTEREIAAQLVLIAKGFIGADPAVLAAFGAEEPQAGSYRAVMRGDDEAPVFVAGDARGGASIVAAAIADGLACVEEVLDGLER